MIQKLDKTIIGKGSVKGIVYNQVYENEAAYIYATDDYFEVFKKEITPICINFEKRIYSETDFKEVYPNVEKFGVNAWTTHSFKEAMKYAESLLYKHKNS